MYFFVKQLCSRYGLPTNGFEFAVGKQLVAEAVLVIGVVESLGRVGTDGYDLIAEIIEVAFYRR